MHKEKSLTKEATLLLVLNTQRQSCSRPKGIWQTGRTHRPGESPSYPANVWPDDSVPQFKEVVDDLYNRMESLSCDLLAACSVYLGKESDWLVEMTNDGNTIMRIIHYPPLGEDVPQGAVRSAAHEDINFITLLVTATADGLEVMDHDGTWIKVEGDERYIIVDSGDMIQNLTNGLFKSQPTEWSIRHLNLLVGFPCQCLFTQEILST